MRKTKRQRYPMPAFIKHALIRNHLTEAYKARPPYQQNDYIGWITQAKLDTTRNKRLAQMIDELQEGDTYMNMDWRPRK